MYSLGHCIFLHFSVSLLLLSLVTKTTETRHCARREFKQSLLQKDAEEAPEDGQKVKLPTDCGRHVASLLRLHSNSNYHRIFNGYDAKLGQFPSYVQEFFPFIGSGAGEVCGGTIITSRHVLTAAHCIPTNVDPARIVVGSGLAAGPNWNQVKSFVKGAEKICKSSRFRRRQQRLFNLEPFMVYDVAIIKLKDDIEFTETVQPACLPKSGSPMAPDQQAYSIGLGFTYKHPGTNVVTEGDKLKVLPSVRVDCPEGYQDESIICSKANKPSHMGLVCQGDSGGPVMGLDDEGRQIVYGIHSYADDKCYGGRFEQEHYIVKSADVHNIRDEIDKLLEECA